MADPADRYIRVRGAREHNLKDVSVDVPRDALVVFTGVSGSGKSSLAFGTLFAEAQRRYFESVAPYARRLIDQVGVPDVDEITGLPPAVALQQQRGTPGARSSVGSVTTLSSLLRMLYSRAGTYPPKQPMLYAEDFSPNTAQGACPTCHGLGRIWDVSEKSLVPDDTLSIRERAVAAWPPAWHGQNLRDILTTLGHDVDVPWRELPKKTRDWILWTEEQPTVPVYAGFTLAEVKRALKQKMEPSYMGTFTGARRYVLHTFATTQSPLMKKRVARFMTGTACPTCDGKRLKPEALGVTFAGYDIAELTHLSVAKMAEVLRPASKGRFDTPSAAEPVILSAAKDLDVTHASHPVILSAAKDLGALRRGDPSPSAQGDSGGEAQDDSGGDAHADREAHRRDIARRVAAGHSAHEGAPDVRRTPNLSEEKRIAAQRITADIVGRIETLVKLGLGYLSLDRSTPTLSPGELQRLRLATQIRSNLFGVVYVLDEPTAGLHPKDGEALLDALEQLKANGNSVFVVEHDLATMRRADWIVDVGPDAGENGGRVLYSGAPDGLEGVAESRTARYLFDAPEARLPPRTRRTPRGWLVLDGVTRNNLHDLSVRFPLGVLTAVTGVSGSGKSSLVSQALVELVCRHLGHDPDLDQDDDAAPGPDAGATVDAEGMPSVADETRGRIASGMEGIRRLVRVDQKPIGRTPRSNLATYTGLFDGVRKLFAATPMARSRRYDAGRFSFNVAKGRCETCEGEGFVSVELLFMPSVYAPCPACHGARYNPKTLEVQWRGHSIADVLGLTVDTACDLFADEPTVLKPLALLRDIGLGYLRLGQPATELSGGEAQRIKLATELQKTQRGTSLYVLDEPTTGLHPSDVDKLMAQLQGLVDAGNTVIVVEHDERVIAQSDWVVEIGPGAGENGGSLVAEGPRE